MFIIDEPAPAGLFTDRETWIQEESVMDRVPGNGEPPLRVTLTTDAESGIQIVIKQSPY